ncbi:unannotated protein [freshwater metagenome]|uniref:Unannotated protein n=1 Tax=freshwater metagenome TaxID=449393 RepID=A0A6J7UXQ6_9ZZZZ
MTRHIRIEQACSLVPLGSVDSSLSGLHPEVQAEVFVYTVLQHIRVGISTVEDCAVTYLGRGVRNTSRTRRCTIKISNVTIELHAVIKAVNDGAGTHDI